MYNIVSIVTGLLGLGFGVNSFEKKGDLRSCFASFLCCACALVFQLLEVHRRVALSDWSALMDTMDFTIRMAIILLAVTTALNLTALLRGRK